MVRSEVYLNENGQHSAVLYTCLHPTTLRKLLFFECFRFLIFHPFFLGVS